jgi:hypothetical protein
MKSSSSSSSCLGSAILLIIALIAIRYALPGLWKVVATIFSTAFYGGIVVVLAGLLLLGYFTYKNYKRNEKKQQNAQTIHVDRTEALYRSVISRLNQDVVLNEVSAEEFLQSELLISDTMKNVKLELARLKDFVSPQNERVVTKQIRDYKQQLQQTTDDAARQVIQENLKILEEKKERMAEVVEEIRRKEASVDLVYNSLIKVEDDLKFGRTIHRIFPPELYTRFGLTPPADQTRITPLTEKSSQDS